MNITIFCIGKLKEKYWNDAVAEYAKRLTKYCKLTIHELKEEMAPERCSEAEKNAILKTEGERILKVLKPSAYAIALCIQGKQLASEQLAATLDDLGVKGKSEVAFIIGGSFGLSDEVQKRADLHLSFSRMTFPHQMMRVILLEQVYRAFKINRNEAYHK